MFSAWIATEIIRLYSGYSGNIQEKVPRLVIFFLLSIFPALPMLLVYFFALQPFVRPVIIGSNIVMLVRKKQPIG